MSVIVCKRLALTVVTLTVAMMLAGCSRTASDADVKLAVETFMTQKNGRSADSAEPYVNIDKLCTESGQSSGSGAFRDVGSVVASLGTKRTMAQGLYHWYAKDIWPAKVELRLACQRGSSTEVVTVSQEFELEYDNDAGVWKVDSSSWGPWPDEPTEGDVFWWVLYSAIGIGLVSGAVAAISRRSSLDMGPFPRGLVTGLIFGMPAGVAVGIYVGFTYQILSSDSAPGLLNALIYGFMGFFVGLLGGAIGGCLGGAGGYLIGRMRGGE